MKKVNRENYLTGLRNAMLWHYSNREIALTLEDVSSVFEEGQKRGRTEQEVAEELGTPEDFILALAKEGGLLPKSRVLQKKVLIIVMLSVVSVYLVMLENNMLEMSDAHRNNFVFCLAAACVPALTHFVAGAGILYCAREQKVRVRGKYILCLLASVLLAGFEQFMLVWACRSAQAPVLECFYVVRVMIVIGVVLLFVLAVRLFRGASWCMGLFSILFGTICSSVVYCDFIKRFEALPQNPWTCISVFPCVIGIVFAGLLYVKNHIRGRLFWVRR